MQRLFTLLLLLIGLTASTFAQPTDLPLPTLTETYIAGGGDDSETLTFRYPQGWTVRETVGQFLIANTSDLTQLSASPIPPDVAGMALIIVDAENLPDGVEQTLTGVAEFFRSATRLAERENVSEDSFTLAEFDAYAIEGASDEGDSMLLVLELDNQTFAVFNGAATSGTLEAIRPVFYAIAASVEYTPDVVPQITLSDQFTEVFDAGTFTIMHPADWTLEREDDQVSFSGIVEVGTDTDGEPLGGALAGAVILFPPDSVPPSVSLEQIASVYSGTLLDVEESAADGDADGDAEINVLEIITNGRDAVLFSNVEEDTVTLVVIARTGGELSTVGIIVGVYDIALDAYARLALARFAGTIDTQAP